jgi:hypothetical protein
MRTEYEEYRDTEIVGAYDPEKAVFRQTGDGGINTIFRDSSYWDTEEGFISERNMLVGGKVFHITSVFPGKAEATPTDKLLSLIDADCSKNAHSA